MEKLTFISNSDTKTKKIASLVGKSAFKGMVITLEGDLGAGKTTFTKGLAEGLNIKANVNSPTFVIIKEYSGDLPLYHMDVYRLANSEEDLGFDEYFFGEGVSVVEWASIVESYLPNNRLDIKIYNIDENTREINFIAIGDKYKEILKVIKNVDTVY